MIQVLNLLQLLLALTDGGLQLAAVVLSLFESLFSLADCGLELVVAVMSLHEPSIALADDGLKCAVAALNLLQFAVAFADGRLQVLQAALRLGEPPPLLLAALQLRCLAVQPPSLGRESFLELLDLPLSLGELGDLLGERPPHILGELPALGRQPRLRLLGGCLQVAGPGPRLFELPASVLERRLGLRLPPPRLRELLALGRTLVAQGLEFAPTLGSQRFLSSQQPLQLCRFGL
mmetsp:Transcript_82854/g.208712  ORF Transcript_82854/g.208712 Transcript_82854/m.208712 type:complete len:234 (-) Transcript_82854:1252-1953(-)